MLVKFTVENFKSFRDEVTLDMQADKTIKKDKNRKKSEILTCAALYGANSGGKSNLIQALEFMKSFVLNSALYGNRRATSINIEPFMFDSVSDKKPSKFEIYFLDQESGKTYCYGFIINKHKVLNEWLYTKFKNSNEYKCIFNRDGDRLDLTGIGK